MAKEKKTEEVGEERLEEKPEKQPNDLRHNCMICGKPGPEMICEHCKIVVQAEAVANKRKVEKEGGGPHTPPR